jgi:hypothetical protein
VGCTRQHPDEHAPMVGIMIMNNTRVPNIGR